MSYRRLQSSIIHILSTINGRLCGCTLPQGWPTVMAVPKWMNHYFYDLENYEGRLCSQNYHLDTLKNEQKESRLITSCHLLVQPIRATFRLISLTKKDVR